MIKNGNLRVAITDDEAPARSRIRDLLEDCAASMALEVAGEAGDGRELIELLQNTAVDVVLLDIRMPEMDGIEAAQHIQKLADPPSVIFTTAYDVYAHSDGDDSVGDIDHVGRNGLHESSWMRMSRG